MAGDTPSRGIVKQRSVSAAFGVSQSGEFVQYAVPERLTSSVFGKDNPPKDWADISLLVPHETIRREEQSMLASIDKLLELSKAKSVKSWQLLYFCEWYNGLFAPFIHEHHDIEERYYFPWLQTKVEIPEKQFAKGHEALVAQLDEIDGICKKVIKKQGIDCDAEILDLHTKMHAFVPDMNEHLMEEERDIPPLAREHFTEEEESKLVESFAQKEFKLSVLRNVWPAVMEAIDAWGTPEQLQKMETTMPGFISKLAAKYWIPDYDNCIKPKRDAPFLDSEPIFKRVGCFGISFCFPCIL